MTSIAFLGVLSAGCAAGAAFFQKKYEELLPLSVMGIVLVLFMFGVAGALEAGFYAVLLCAVALYLITAVRLCMKKELRGFLSNMVTPGSLIFVGTLGLLTVWNRGKLAMAWDEFSHWVDIAKVMTTIDDFGTNPLSGSAFQSYPPAMTLFQYFLQKLNTLLHPGEEFSEWRVYLAYQVFFFSVMMPVFRNKTFRSPLVLACTVVAVFAGPLLFYHDIFASVYIDAFLGILSGAGLTAVLFTKEKDIFYSIYIWMLCAVLVLTKDAGMAFAVFLTAAYGVDLLLDGRYTPMHKARMTGAATAAVILPKLLWKWEIAVSGAAVNFNKEVELKAVARLILGRDGSYRSTVVDNFRNALFEKQLTLGNISISVNYAILLLTELFLFYLLYQAYKARNPEGRRQKAAVFCVAGAQLVLYTFGLCLIYAFKFSEYEAVRLASFTRYLHIGFLAGWVVILGGVLWCMAVYLQGNRVLEVAALYAMLVAVPMKPIVDLANGVTVEESLKVRKPYEALTGKILELTPEGSSVYLVSQETTGMDYWIMRFGIRPNRMNENYSWSIGEPFYEGDVWTKSITAQQWQTLLAAEYDYVALYKVNDYFKEHFAEVFDDPESIAANTVYRVDKQTGTLFPCK